MDAMSRLSQARLSGPFELGRRLPLPPGIASKPKTNLRSHLESIKARKNEPKTNLNEPKTNPRPQQSWTSKCFGISAIPNVVKKRTQRNLSEPKPSEALQTFAGMSIMAMRAESR
jgi:hypothetical protein